MAGIMRDPIWQFVGALLAFIGILGSLIGYLIQRNRRSLAYDIVTSTQLIGISNDLADDIQVLFRGVPIPNVWLVVARILNEGNVPVKTADYERPITIVFGETATILQAEVVQAKPSNLDLVITQDAHCVTLSPTLLNPMDYVTIKALVSNLETLPIVSARIVGIKKIRPVGRYAVFAWSMPLFGVGLAMIIVGAVVGAWLSAVPIFIGGLVAGFAILSTPVLYDYRYKRFWLRWLWG
jgi:hypothetical protein